MIKIGLDCLGNDNGQIEFLKAVKKVQQTNNSLFFNLYGYEKDIKKIIDEERILPNNIDIINCEEEILINEHPVFALRNKKKSSLYISGNDLNNNNIDCLISAGSTGALLALAQLYIKTIDFVKRPAIGAILPTINKPLLLIDSGANVDPDAYWLYQYAILGSIYMKNIFGLMNPKIGLLNIGVEEVKGNKLTLETYRLLKEDNSINFIGNVEAREVTSGVCDVLVCDAFSGNIVLKMYEGVAKNLLSVIKDAINKSFISKVCGLFIKNNLKSVLLKFDATSYGGAPLLGSSKLIIKCHGSSKYKEIYNAILEAEKFVSNDLINKFNERMKKRTNGI